MASSRNVRLATANFLASLGGGGMLGAGLAVFPTASLNTISPLAFLLGSGLGFLFLLFINHHSGQNSECELEERFGPWGLSLATLLASLGLTVVYVAAVDAQGKLPGGAVMWLFLGLLVSRWAAWYAGRAQRSSMASTYERRSLPLVEGSYFAGIVSGLILQSLLTHWIGESPHFLWFAIADLLGNGIACRLDMIRWTPPGSLEKVPLPAFARIVTLVCVSVIGIQISIFVAASGFADKGTASAMLAAFYFGALLSTVAVRSFPITMESIDSLLVGKRRRRWGTIWPILLAFVATIASLLALEAGQNIAAACFIVSAAFFLGVLYLTAFGHIGQHDEDRVRLAFGWMAVTGSVSMVLLDWADDFPALISSALFGLVLCSILVSVDAVKHSIDNSGSQRNGRRP